MYAPPPPASTPLSLHDALPISATTVRITPPTLQCVTRSMDYDSYGYSGCGTGLAAGCASNEAGRDGSEVTEIDENAPPDRKSTRLNSSHPSISYAVFCLKKKKP